MKNRRQGETSTRALRDRQSRQPCGDVQESGSSSLSALKAYPFGEGKTAVTRELESEVCVMVGVSM